MLSLFFLLALGIKEFINPKYQSCAPQILLSIEHNLSCSHSVLSVSEKLGPSLWEKYVVMIIQTSGKFTSVRPEVEGWFSCAWPSNPPRPDTLSSVRSPSFKSVSSWCPFSNFSGSNWRLSPVVPSISKMSASWSDSPFLSSSSPSSSSSSIYRIWLL